MITKLLLLSISIFLVSRMMEGIRLKSFVTAIIVAVVYSVADLLLWWLMVFFSMPLIILTFGLFVFVLNAILLWLTDQIVDDFEIKDLKTTFIASLIISAINLLLNWLI
ncbi:phage holin family protein [Thalassotalea psychrophila]|uniref:Phage holin family protein n=1 Tax=Thalassotalea psychrophila TaxID=3065647 RepID=A0ABY9TXD0_9GAMM|nr:phage holin family protein [Colwelliaceae bacterium SQ149]